ncbi:MAG: AMP-binding protein [Parvibaculum sp.]
MNIATLLETAALTSRGSAAISSPEETLLTYGAFHERAARLAAGLAASGLRPGDRVALAMSNCTAYYEIMFGTWMAGLCVAPMNPRLHVKEFAFAISDSGARLSFATPEIAPALAAELGDACRVIETGSPDFEALFSNAPAPMADVSGDAPAWLFYTSGTTGKPKGAVLTHRNLMAMVVSFLADSGTCIDDNILHLAPLSHASGMLGLAYIARGRNNVVLPSLERGVLEDALTRFAPLSFFAVPTVVRRLMEPSLLEPKLVPSIRRIFFGGAPMYVEDLKRAAAHFGTDRLWQLYGQGEAPCTISYMPPHLIEAAIRSGDDKRLGSVGIPRSGVAVRIVSEEGAPCAAGEVGEVTVQGDVVMAGYWGRTDATADAIRGGWLHTGDLGFMDEHGYLTLVDRSKDMIISGGSNIYPREIEEVLLLHPHVAECSVIGVPDAEWGEVPVAFVVSTGEKPARESFDALCLDHLARYKRPRDYILVDELPKSSYGKILKSALRESWAGRG